MRQALERKTLLAEVERLRGKMTEDDGLAARMGPSPQVRRVVEKVRLVADSSLTVLIHGETGTGKELVAQALHRESARRMRPLIAIDCGAIPDSLLESELFGHEKGALHRGRTWEVRSLSARRGRHAVSRRDCQLASRAPGEAPARPRITRDPTARRGCRQAIDVRFVVATSRDLRSCLQSGAFREDLYFRLAQFTIDLPPLRERPSDIPVLAARFREEACIELRRPVFEIAPAALALLHRHPWPRNVRELRNVIRQAVLQSETPILGRDLIAGLLTSWSDAPAPRSTPAPGAGRSLKQIADAAVHESERAAICDALRAASGNQSHAARALQVDYKTLHIRLKRYGIRPREFGPN